MLTKEFLKKAEDELNKKYYAEIVVKSYHNDEYIGERTIETILLKGDSITINIGGLVVSDSGDDIVVTMRKWWECWK